MIDPEVEERIRRLEGKFLHSPQAIFTRPISSPRSMAGTTFSTPIWLNIQIRPAVGMPLGAMSLEGNRGIATPNIFTVSNQFDVSRVNTRGKSAEVVRLQASRDRADELLICPAVGEHEPRARPELPITQFIAGSDPLPAAVLASMNFTPESDKPCAGSILRGHRKVTPFGVVQPVVTRHAAASIIRQGRN